MKKIHITEKALTIILWVEIAILAVPLLYFGARAFVCDSFIVKGHSMEPTLYTGKRVYVNKLLMGGRIYTKFDFDSDELHCFRMPGLRKLRVGDLAIYNYQYGWEPGKIGFKINYVYAKRCVACPGDTISIVDGHYVNSRTGSVGIPESNEEELRSLPDSFIVRMGSSFKAGSFAGEKERWTIKDFGPIAVPAKGMKIRLDSLERRHYARFIEYETGAPADSLPDTEYTFRENYYFFAGDNVINSRDGRYDGFVPEDYVIGIFR